MKQKLLLSFMIVLMTVSCTIGFAACDFGGGGDTHTHTYSTEWAADDTYHWHDCTGTDCDEVADKAAHEWDEGAITTEPTCTEDGVKTYTCEVCGKTKTESVTALGHDFS